MEKVKILRISLLIISGLFFFSGCDENNNIVLFSVQNDLELGKQVSDEINADPQYVKMSRAQYPDAYAYLDALVLEILDKGNVAYRDEFVWEVTLLQGDVLNAFATPGGYIYVYSGLIKFLDNADDLAGVLGHEIAHADLRHTSRNLQKIYGVQVLLSVVLGQDQGTLSTIASQIASGAAALKFSREFESESDDRAVEYNANTIYACDGVKNFFQKLEDLGLTGSTPEFLSTHPSPDTRIADITAKANELQCNTNLLNDGGAYTAFKNSLPL